LLRFVYSHTKNSPLGPGTMFVFAGLLYLVAVAVACALPKELANSRRPGQDDDEDDYMPLYESSTNAEASEGTIESSSSYGSV
jgi:hypothetical protein